MGVEVHEILCFGFKEREREREREQLVKITLDTANNYENDIECAKKRILNETH